MNEWIMTVDENDSMTGYGEKIEVHRNAVRHRAFSVFILNIYDGKILVQKRAGVKYHSGGLWSNSCCSHQRRGESLSEAVLRGVRHELGLNILLQDKSPDMDLPADAVCGQLHEAGVFSYFKQFPDLAENEIDHVFYILVDEADIKVEADPDECNEVKWISVSGLRDWLESSPESFTAWFPKAFELLQADLGNTGMKPGE